MVKAIAVVNGCILVPTLRVGTDGWPLCRRACNVRRADKIWFPRRAWELDGGTGQCSMPGRSRVAAHSINKPLAPFRCENEGQFPALGRWIALAQSARLSRPVHLTPLCIVSLWRSYFKERASVPARDLLPRLVARADGCYWNRLRIVGCWRRFK